MNATFHRPRAAFAFALALCIGATDRVDAADPTPIQLPSDIAAYRSPESPSARVIVPSSAAPSVR